MVFRIILSAVLLAGTAPAQEAAAPALSEDQRLLHVLSRLTPGVTPELVAEVRSRGLGPWLEAQFQGFEGDAFAGRRLRAGQRACRGQVLRRLRQQRGFGKAGQEAGRPARRQYTRCGRCR
mgnify:CR=1 FL=1